MLNLHENDILTRVTKYNLIRDGRMIHIDLHEKLAGRLADVFIAVPNLINIVARTEYQGSGATAEEALEDCLVKIKGLGLEDIFPQKGDAE